MPIIPTAPGPQRPRSVTILFSTGRINAALADGFASRLLGLLIGPPRPLLLTGTRAVHSFGMRATLDLIFIDRQQRVVKTVNDFRPWRFAFCRHGNAVLELPAGQQPRPSLGEQLEILWR